jgi:pimeloyl-ACP methyl ester carboxylesterase
MAPLAAQILHGYNAQGKRSGTKGLVAVSFDQRNHGSRLVDSLHNEAWRQGNPRHAQDMFGCFHGTAQDTSHLITHLESYIFHTPSHPKITEHFVLGVSLGGHAAWHLILSDPRITAAVVGIGCPDYTRLMTDRARLSKRKAYTESNPPGSSFLGSADFPKALLQSIAESDPAGLLLPNSYDPQHQQILSPPPDKAKLDRMRALLRERLQGKQILALSGKVDKLVPYAAGEPFLKVFKELIQEDKSLDVGFEDVLFDGVGHAFPKAMADKATSWICDVLAGKKEGGVSSKI